MSKRSLSIISDQEAAPELACELVEMKELSEITPLDEELALLPKKTSEKREHEFVLGREAAHRALRSLGHTTASIVGKGAGKEPLWPEGFVGSISHTQGAALAVAGPSHAFASLGADLERVDRAIKKDVLSRIALPAERAWVTAEREEEALRTLLLFSAKESGYKAFYPLTKKYMGFKDLFVRWDEENQSFIGTLLVDLNEEHRAGDLILIQSVVQEPYIMTCAMLPSADE